MTDARDDYQIALTAYNEARAVAIQQIKMIENVSSALRSELRSFLGWQYNVQMSAADYQSTRYSDKARFDMTQWPDAATIQSALVKWHAAFVALRSAWGKMSNSQQIGFQPPPDKMTTTN